MTKIGLQESCLNCKSHNSVVIVVLLQFLPPYRTELSNETLHTDRTP